MTTSSAPGLVAAYGAGSASRWDEMVGPDGAVRPAWQELSQGARRAALGLWSWDYVADRIRELAAAAADDGPEAGR